MADGQLVLAFFPDEGAAGNAAAALKDSGIAHGDAIGILALDSHGKLKQDKVGARSTGKGTAMGGVIAAWGSGHMGVGSHRQRGGWSSSSQEPGGSVRWRQGAPRLRGLNAKAAVAVMAGSDTAPAISDQLHPARRHV